MEDPNEKLKRRARQVTEALASLRELRAEVELSYGNVAEILDALEQRVRSLGNEEEAPS